MCIYVCVCVLSCVCVRVCVCVWDQRAITTLDLEWGLPRCVRSRLRSGVEKDLSGGGMANERGKRWCFRWGPVSHTHIPGRTDPSSVFLLRVSFLIIRVVSANFLITVRGYAIGVHRNVIGFDIPNNTLSGSSEQHNTILKNCCTIHDLLLLVHYRWKSLWAISIDTVDASIWWLFTAWNFAIIIYFVIMCVISFHNPSPQQSSFCLVFIIRIMVWL